MSLLVAIVTLIAFNYLNNKWLQCWCHMTIADYTLLFCLQL